MVTNEKNYEPMMYAMVEQAIILDEIKLKSLPTDALYLVPFLAENYATFAETLKIWHEPRTTHKGTIIVKHKSNTFILADKRFSPYLPSHMKIKMDSATKVIASEEVGKSCHQICQIHQLECAANQFHWINNGETLGSHFDCKAYIMGVGDDTPCFLSDPNHIYYETCVVKETIPTCEGNSTSTKRICTCK